MPRKFDVKGTKEYFYWSVGLGLLTIWAIRDGWAGYWAQIGLETFVSNVLRDHPDYPGDSFYMFNRILTFISGIASIVCGVIHRIVR
ncbi:MAG TPA: hypothetical protein PJ991_10385 [Kiritimatiellia bacterium]|mgnify:CR=1 FL=1|nr:hypothetical protein [Kiritimatiellia bacterium]